MNIAVLRIMYHACESVDSSMCRVRVTITDSDSVYRVRVTTTGNGSAW